jgi:hypothetical protein
MLKTTTAIITAAFIAGIITLMSSPAPVDAGPVAKPVEIAIKACVNQPWPYLRCVGTQFGNPHIRLVSTDRLN